MLKRSKKDKNYLGAGIVFITPKKEILLLKKNNNKLTFPGGHKEEYETLPYETAIRECWEELGITPNGTVIGKIKIAKQKNELPIYSFFMNVNESFIPTLSLEHKDYKWVYYKKVNAQKLTNVFKPMWNIYKKYISILP